MSEENKKSAEPSTVLDYKEFTEEINGVKYPLKFKIGRPTKYDPKFCDLVIKAGMEGKSSSYICSMLAIGRTTLDRFMAAHEEFRDAYHLSQEYSCEWWESQARRNIKDPAKSFNANLYAFHMRNRFKHHYSESMGSIVSLNTNSTTPQAENANKEIKEKLDELERKIRDGKTA